MKRIDRETIQRILDTADIVDVVSDFVSLKRRGANYIGLCPFHNERTPSFSVSRSKGICKCFSCGKGGSAVGFLMELEQLSYNEALRYLAKKYNIEIREHEMSDAERERESERESMLAVNEYAMGYFERTLTDTADGRNIGLAYFRERGINDAMIKRFHLGYSLDRRDDLLRTATAAGYSEQYLTATGLCYRTERGINDRFRARVIYPVFTISGKVVAFGGRTLRKDKEVAKYVNSPESAIYHKSSELYGLYQAKQAIARKDKCILVEGYMDVISMHQSGMENVVASSGTSLTEGQIRLIHRFTENVTVIYDSDPAGIKASLRGIDLLLAEGLNIKVLSLPDGDDPDSFAQSHTSDEVERYLAANEQDFIAFKTRILLQGTESDPIARSRAIRSIVRSISVIPDNITRTVYIGECSRSLGVDENTLRLQVAKYAAEQAEQKSREARRERNRAAAGLPPTPEDDTTPDTTDNIDSLSPEATPSPLERDMSTTRHAFLLPYEEEVVRYAVKYGVSYLCDVTINDQGATAPMTVIEFILEELAYDNIELTSPLMRMLLSECKRVAESWSQAEVTERTRIEEARRVEIEQGVEEIRRTSDDLATIDVKERALIERADANYRNALDSAAEQYVQRSLLSSPIDDIRREATRMVSTRHSLSKIHTRYSKIPTERDRLTELVPMAVQNLRGALLECEISEINKEIARVYASSPDDSDRLRALMQRTLELNALKKEMALYLGERILSPHLK